MGSTLLLLGSPAQSAALSGKKLSLCGATRTCQRDSHPGNKCDVGEAGWPCVCSPSVLIRLSPAHRPFPFSFPSHPGNPERSPPIIHLDRPLAVWGPAQLAQRLLRQGLALRKKGGQGTVSSAEWRLLHSALLLSSEPPEPRTPGSFTPHAGCPGTGWSLVTWEAGRKAAGSSTLAGTPWLPLALGPGTKTLRLSLPHPWHRGAASRARPPLRWRELS